MSDHNDDLNELAAAVVKAAIGQSKLYIDGVKIDWDGGIGKPAAYMGEKVIITVAGDVNGKLTLSGETKKMISKLFNQHKLVAELKQKDKDIQTMIAEQKETLAILSAQSKEIEALKDRMARLHKLSELED